MRLSNGQNKADWQSTDLQKVVNHILQSVITEGKILLEPQLWRETFQTPGYTLASPPPKFRERESVCMTLNTEGGQDQADHRGNKQDGDCAVRNQG